MSLLRNSVVYSYVASQFHPIHHASTPISSFKGANHVSRSWYCPTSTGINSLICNKGDAAPRNPKEVLKIPSTSSCHSFSNPLQWYINWVHHSMMGNPWDLRWISQGTLEPWALKGWCEAHRTPRRSLCSWFSKVLLTAASHGPRSPSTSPPAPIRFTARTWYLKRSKKSDISWWKKGNQ